MDQPFRREFRLSEHKGDAGIFCDASGAYVGGIALLKRTTAGGRDIWKPRSGEELSNEVSSRYGVPIDVSSKAGGLAAIARALNEGNVARAQVATVLLAFPDAPPQSKSAPPSRNAINKMARELYWSGLLKADWDPDEHPCWPAGAPGSQGGEFAPKGEGGFFGQSDEDQNTERQSFAADASPLSGDDSSEPVGSQSDSLSLTPAVYHGEAETQLEDVAYQGDFHDEMVRNYAAYLRAAGFNVETEVRVSMADGSAHTRVDVLAQMAGQTFGVEVKTGKRPFPTLSQLLIYPHMIYGESVLSTDLKITTFGFKPWQILPKIPVLVMYVRDRDTEPVFKEFDPKKMLDEYYRLIRRIRRIRKILEALTKAFDFFKGRK